MPGESLEGWLETPLSRWTALGAVPVVTLTVGRALVPTSAVLAVASAVAAALGALAVLGRTPRLGDLVGVLLPCAALAWIPRESDVLGLRAAFAPFAAHEPGQGLLFGVRIGLLFLALVRLRVPRFSRPEVVVGALGLLFLASLAVRALVVPCFLVAVAVIRLGRPAEVASTIAPRWLTSTLLVAGSIGLVVPAASVRTTPAPPDDPRAAVVYWRGRRNLHHARAVALAWAQREPVPSDGYLELAMVDWDLGERAKARKVLSKVLARAESEPVRRKANELRNEWGE
ncbi:MAG: hypothetical protein KIT84_23465 [Labilithrix sp.]|nr:hypothetical protein [Labilithrix sp.]MCW5814007.1 hypothetical protein [Labilithrix sp.]